MLKDLALPTGGTKKQLATRLHSNFQQGSSSDSTQLRALVARLVQEGVQSALHCKNKCIEITHAWLPELHTSKDNCNSGNQAWVTSTHLFLQCTPAASSSNISLPSGSPTRTPSPQQDVHNVPLPPQSHFSYRPACKLQPLTQPSPFGRPPFSPHSHSDEDPKG